MHLRTLLTFGLVCLAGSAVAQVDIEHRRTLTLQTGSAVYQSEEALGVFGYFWFNENHYPWTNTALRVIYAGVYLDTELSYYVAGNTNTALGLGAGGGLYVAGLTPYRKGERLSQHTFHGDDVGGRVFLNQTIPNPTPLPVNVRATYHITQFFYRTTSGTASTFTLPADFFLQTVRAELRVGGIEPGLLAGRGVQLYLAADANYRSGFDAFGATVPPVVLRHQSNYERLFASLSARAPAGPLQLSGRVCGGYGERLDQLSAWKLGGNLVNIDPYAYTLHGYYLRELFADRFLMANLALSMPISANHQAALHYYADWAVARGVAPLTREYHNYIGVGVGLSFRGPWQTDFLVSYGYGLNAERNGDRGGHEISLGLEKQF